MEANKIFYSVFFFSFFTKEVKKILLFIAAEINLDAMCVSLFICSPSLSPSFISYSVFFLAYKFIHPREFIHVIYTKIE